MVDDIQYVTQDKLEALESELKELKTNTIPLIAKRIDEARQMGDLSENAEYHAAREEMGWAQGRSREIQHILDHVSVFRGQSSTSKNKSVTIGSTIVVQSNGKEKEFTIVGAQEADPINGLISNESPLGQAFLGKEKGASVEVKVPAGVQVYTVLDIK